MKIVISVLGRDRVGIIAMVSTVLAENGVNILNLDQTILDGFFNMIMTADMNEAKVSLKELQEILRGKVDNGEIVEVEAGDDRLDFHPPRGETPPPPPAAEKPARRRRKGEAE